MGRWQSARLVVSGMSPVQKVLLVLLILFAGVRLILTIFVFRNPERFIVADSEQYIRLATNLLTIGKYEAIPGYDGLSRPPGYPTFLLPFLGIFEFPFGFVALIQQFASIITATLTFFLGQRLTSRASAGLLAAALVILSPTASFWALMIMPGTVFALIILMGFWWLYRYYDDGAIRDAAVAGALFGLATLVRPIGFYILPVLTLFIFIYAWRDRSSQWVLRPLAFLGLAALIVVPWMVRNQAVYGAFNVSNTGGHVIRNQVAADTLAEVEGISRDQAQGRIGSSENPNAMAISIIINNPLQFLRAQSRGIIATLQGWDLGNWAYLTRGTAREGSGLVSQFLRLDFVAAINSLRGVMNEPTGQIDVTLQLYSLIFTAALFLSTVVGFLRGLLRGSISIRWMSLSLALVAAYLLIIPLSQGGPRFRVPAEPLMALLAGLIFLARDQIPQERAAVIENELNVETVAR